MGVHTDNVASSCIFYRLRTGMLKLLSSKNTINHHNKYWEFNQKLTLTHGKLNVFTLPHFKSVMEMTPSARRYAWYRNKWNSGKPNSRFPMTNFIWFPPYVCIHKANRLIYTAGHIHKQQYVWLCWCNVRTLGDRTGSVRVMHAAAVNLLCRIGNC